VEDCNGGANVAGDAGTSSVEVIDIDGKADEVVDVDVIGETPTAETFPDVWPSRFTWAADQTSCNVWDSKGTLMTHFNETKPASCKHGREVTLDMKQGHGSVAFFRHPS
jgi:hypothetical protein